MAAAPERSSTLHYFTLPRLKWGNQRFLRCTKVKGANGGNRMSSAQSDVSDRCRAATRVIKHRYLSDAPESYKIFSPLKTIGSDRCNGIEAVREKVMLDLRVAAHKMKGSILEEKEIEELNSATRPWNLRTRRAACKAPNESAGGSGKGANLRSKERQQRNNCNSSPLRPEIPMASAKSSRLRGLTATTTMTTTQGSVERREHVRAKFSIPL